MPAGALRSPRRRGASTIRRHGREKIRDMFDECCKISVDCRGRVVECEARDIDEEMGGWEDPVLGLAEALLVCDTEVT